MNNQKSCTYSKKEVEKFLNDIDEKTESELELLLDDASYEYYNTGETLITDEQFDFIKEFLVTKFPQTTKYTSQIGCDIAGKVVLPAHMGSMTNIKDSKKFSIIDFSIFGTINCTLQNTLIYNLVRNLH